MYIKELQIKKYKILNDLTVKFQSPTNSNNVVNVIAGINGTGKTSLLESIAKGFDDIISPKDIHLTLDKETERKRKKNLIEYFKEKNEQIIYFASHLIHLYSPVTQLENEYKFIDQLESKKILGNTEYYIREYILAQERNSHEADPRKRTRVAIDDFNQHFQEANLLTKLYDLDSKHFNRPIFKQDGNNIAVSIEHLSAGERQIYGHIVSLMIVNPSNSIILIDEPELGLHPAWQQVIMSIYTKIGQNNQFIIATHSPQVIATTHFNNLILLKKNMDSHNIEVIYPKHPPSGIDINSILLEFMGADFIPKGQIELYRQYRKFVEQRQENSELAKKIKQKILEKEDRTSEFMQEMQFIIRLRGD